MYYNLLFCYFFWNSYLLTCGSDGDVRIYKDFDDSDPESVRVGDNVTVLAVKVSIDWIVCVVVYINVFQVKITSTYHSGN